ncbi:MAG: hypothetical protein H0X42_12970, partial [Solirubrobacterales bacterium]|nr:hypothetical protein [Solirubrobacterales bacterium]
SGAAATAPAAASACANQGGELPDPLALAAFAQQITLASEGEWTGEMAVYTGVNSYSVVTVSPTGDVGAAVSTATKQYRCVLPLVG